MQETTPMIRRAGTRLLASLPLLMIAGSALAQPVNKAKEGNAWVAFVVAIVLAIAVAAVCFMSPRRGHQD